MSLCNIVFSPSGKTVKVEAGTNLLEAATRAGIVINSLCGGEGRCGHCKVIVRQGKSSGDGAGLLTPEEVRQHVSLACQSHVQSDLQVEIPEESRAVDRVDVDKDVQRFRAVYPGITQRHFTRGPLVGKVYLKLAKPTLEDHLADAQRIRNMLEKEAGLTSTEIDLKILRRLPQILRDNDFAVTAMVGKRGVAAEILNIEGGNTSARNYMAIVDVGTSTIVVHLVEVVEMKTVDTQACFNSQAVYGREVTARIMASEKRGSKQLQELVVSDINRMIDVLVERNKVRLEDITAVVCSGNTTMMHFLLGLPAGNIRRRPYIAACTEPPPLSATEIGITINPRGLLFVVPGISSWVGGDLTAGVLATGLHESSQTAMLIDVGTNGEIIIGNREWLMACSASTGPALEGASVECGMLAETGAIERIYPADNQIRYTVIGDVSPIGICGSGIIDLLAVLLDKGIIDRAGQFVENSDPRVRFESERGRFLIATKAEREARRDVYVTQDDIDNVITAKAAIFAATKILLDRLDLDYSHLHTLFIAGGFGSYIDRRNAIKIGLLPDMPVPRIQYVGNTSIWGAKLAGFSEEAYTIMRDIAARTTYYDLIGSPDYVEQFQQAMFLPHTNIELFPSVCHQAPDVAVAVNQSR